MTSPPSSKATLMASLSFSSFAANVKVLDVVPVEEELDDGGVILEAERIRCFKDLFSASNSHVPSPALEYPFVQSHRSSISELVSPTVSKLTVALSPDVKVW